MSRSTKIVNKILHINIIIIIPVQKEKSTNIILLK